MKRTLTFLLVLCCLLPFASQAAETGKQDLQYCILSHEAIAQNQFADFLVDFMPLRNTTVRVALFKAKSPDKPLREFRISPPPMVPRTFRFDGKVGSRLIEPGDYVLRFLTRQPDERYDLAFAVLEPQAQLPLRVTGEGEFLPMDASDEASIQKAMAAPVAVVDIQDVGHMPLRDKPGGRKVGEVHGQNAALRIIKLDVQGHALVGAHATDDGSYVEGYVPQNKLKMVATNPRYGLLIDKQKQTMRIYEQGKLLGEVQISTGLMARHRLLRETRAGAFLTGDRQIGFGSGGFRYDYAIRIDGGNLIHQLGWKRVDGSPSFSEQLKLLGQKASTGCVRVQQEESPEGLSALWLWTHLPRNTKLLVLDDPAERAARYQELFPGKSVPVQVPTAPQQAQQALTPGALKLLEGAAGEAPADGTRITLTFTGDCILGSEEKSRALPHSFDSTIAEKGYAWPFSGVQEVISKDDLTVVNFEGVLKDDRTGREEGKLHWFRGPTDFVNILKEGSVELAGLANNHVRDYGQAGRNSTKKALTNGGIPFFGYGDLYTYEKDGVKIGFGGIRETIWRQDRERPAREIAQLRSEGCHYIVYSCHFGNEYKPISQLQRTIAYNLVDSGADVVVGTHPHIVQGVEAYKHGLILYSLGNFSFGGNLELTVFDGLMAQLQLDFTGDKKLDLTTLKLLPVLTTGTAPANDFRPVLAQSEDKARILNSIQQQSPLKVSEEMRFKAVD